MIGKKCNEGGRLEREIRPNKTLGGSGYFVIPLSIVYPTI
jgi:hypothetical protein